MFICEYEFKHEDKNHLGYSMTEIDYYAWIPVRFHKTERNHRLSLWKNLKTNEYELVKVYMNQITGIMPLCGGLIISNVPNGKTEVVFHHKDLNVVLVEGNELWNYYHGTSDYKREVDKVCEHEFPNISNCCQFKED